MPYIKQEDREIYDEEIHKLVEKLTNFENKNVISGHINYVFSKILWNIFRKNGPSYTLGNNLMGVLACVSQEFYRKQLSNYENLKEKENGPI